MERSTQFYRDTLGLPQTADGGFPEFKLGDNGFLYLLSMEAIGSQFRVPHDAGFALRVADGAEGREELEAEGGQLHGEVLATAVCHMAFFGDPDGNQMVLHRRYAPSEA